MTPETIAIIGLGLSIGTFFIGRVSAGKSDGKEQGILINKVDNLMMQISELSQKMDTKLTDITDEIKDLRERLAKVESSTKQAHHRLDDITKGN